MPVVVPMTEPIWVSSHEAPSATQPPRASSTLLTPKPATCEAAAPAEAATWQTGPSPVVARAAAAAGQAAPGSPDGAQCVHPPWTPEPAL